MYCIVGVTWLFLVMSNFFPSVHFLGSPYLISTNPKKSPHISLQANNFQNRLHITHSSCKQLKQSTTFLQVYSRKFESLMCGGPSKSRGFKKTCFNKQAVGTLIRDLRVSGKYSTMDSKLDV